MKATYEFVVSAVAAAVGMITVLVSIYKDWMVLAIATSLVVLGIGLYLAIKSPKRKAPSVRAREPREEYQREHELREKTYHVR